MATKEIPYRNEHKRNKTKHKNKNKIKQRKTKTEAQLGILLSMKKNIKFYSVVVCFTTCDWSQDLRFVFIQNH